MTARKEQLPERAAINQSRFRAYNERIEPHNAVHHWVDPPYADWVCECAFEDCTMPARLTVAEYQAIREHPARFLVAPGDDHVVPDVERVVARRERYWVVEKLGEAAEISETLDHRAGDATLEDADVFEVVAHAADQVAWNLPPPSRSP